MTEIVAQQTSRSRAASASQGTREFLVFVLAGEPYAVGLARVREILVPPPITKVPRAGSEVLGLCSVRGLLVTVLDLRRLLKLEQRGANKRNRILLAESEHGDVIGLFVDEVRHVARLGEAELELTTSSMGSDISEHVLGIGRPSGEVVILLDLASLISS
jgi:purine-binding chemotaxis protein CheW